MVLEKFQRISGRKLMIFERLSDYLRNFGGRAKGERGVQLRPEIYGIWGFGN